jgi:hypothetical protein
MAKVIKFLGLFIISIIIGFYLTFYIAENNSAIGNSIIPFFLWGFFAIVITISLNGLITRVGKRGKPGTWEPPEQIRDKVVTAAQFVGRLDRGRGLLESTARMVDNDFTTKGNWFRPGEVNYAVLRFRAELLDRDGIPLENVPVEITAERSKWIGNIVEGDRVRVEGKFESDGILHAKNAFNYSTNSWVGERR